MTTTLLDRLTAAIDEDERIAREAGGVPWTDDVTAMVHVDPAVIRDNKLAYGHLGFVASADRSLMGDAYRRHIARQNPKATLIRCAADRKTVQRHAPVQGPIRTLCATCHHVTPNGYAMRVEWPCPTLLDRAAAYDLTVEED